VRDNLFEFFLAWKRETDIGYNITVTQKDLLEVQRKAVLSARKASNGLMKELSLIKQLGFARDLGEFARGINAVAAPVFGPGQQVAGVLLLFGMLTEDKTERFGRRTADASKRISQRLGN
jgi:DNA-binding IclR family transcriptional regulator